MKRLLVVSSAVVGFLAGTYAMAQEATLTIDPDQQTVIKQYVVKERVRPMRIKEHVAVGVDIPADVELQPVPEEVYTKVPETRKYEYFDWDNHVVFVDPSSRKVVQIID